MLPPLPQTFSFSARSSAVSSPIMVLRPARSGCASVSSGMLSRNKAGSGFSSAVPVAVAAGTAAALPAPVDGPPGCSPASEASCAPESASRSSGAAITCMRGGLHLLAGCGVGRCQINQLKLLAAAVQASTSGLVKSVVTFARRLLVSRQCDGPCAGSADICPRDLLCRQS